jgi:hypothetical protein
MWIMLNDAPPPDANGQWHFTYVTYDPDTFEWYGGKHTTSDLADGYIGSGHWIADHIAPERLTFEVVAFYPNETAAYAAEAELVTDQMVMDDALCMNLLGGGRGFTSKFVLRLVADPAYRAKKSASLKVAFADPAFKARQSVLLKAAFAQPGAFQRKSAGLKAALASPEVRASISARQKISHNRPEVKKAIKTALADPEVKARQIAGQTATWADPEVRTSRSEGIKAAHARPEVKIRVCAGRKVAWIKRRTKPDYDTPDAKARRSAATKAGHAKRSDSWRQNYKRRTN